MSDPFYLSREWRALRRQVLKRDGYQCRVLSCTVAGASNLSVHHIVPKADGGGDYKENLITLCNRHHDEIEVAGVRIVALVEAWESPAKEDAAGVSSTILDRFAGNGRVKPLRDTVKPLIVPPKRKGHLCEPSTIDALHQFRQGKTLVAAAKELGFSPIFSATISGILANKPGAISAKGEILLRSRLHLPPVHKRIRTMTIRPPRPRQATSQPKVKAPHTPIPSEEIEAALAGDDPPRGYKISLARLGRRLARHRGGRYPGLPYTKQAIAIYIKTPSQQGPDFTKAFLAWRDAERERQEYLTTSGIKALLEKSECIYELGEGGPMFVFAIGDLPPGALIFPDGLASKIVLNRSPIRTCACGRRFVARSWNHHRCGPDCPNKQSRNLPAHCCPTRNTPMLPYRQIYLYGATHATRFHRPQSRPSRRHLPAHPIRRARPVYNQPG